MFTLPCTHTCTSTHTHTLTSYTGELSAVVWRGWDGGGGGVVGGEGGAYFEILAERRKKNRMKHVGIDVMEGDRIKKEMKRGMYFEERGGGRAGEREAWDIWRGKGKDDKRKTGLNVDLKIGMRGRDGGCGGSPISFLPSEPTSLPRSQQCAPWLSKTQLIMHPKAYFMLL